MPATYQTVATLVRAYLDETEEPIVWTDTNLFAIASAAQRDVQRDLASRGVKIMEDDVVLIVPAGQTVIAFDDGSALPLGYVTLPDDLVIPHRLSERGATENVDERPMEKRRERLTTAVQSAALEEWLWKAGSIKLRGATTDRALRIEYERQLADFDDPASRLAIPGSENAIAWKTVAGSEYARGNQSLLDRAEARYAAAFDALARLYVNSQQNAPVRRRPYSAYR